MVAVLLATYNGELYISKTLESLVNQTYEDYVIYIHDDGSADKTLDIAKEYQKKYPQKVVIIDHPYFGSATKNFLFLLESVKADIYMFADQDDIWDKKKVEILVKEYYKEGENDNPLLLFSDMSVIDSDGVSISDSYFDYCNLKADRHKLNQIIAQNVVPGCASLFNSPLRKEVLKCANRDNIIQHDWWLACVAAATGNIIYVDKKLVHYRNHGKNVIGANKDWLLRDVQKIFSNSIRHSVTESKNRTKRFVRQAMELSNTDIKNNKDKTMIMELSEFFRKGKLGRLKLLIKYRIMRNKRNIWMAITL